MIEVKPLDLSTITEPLADEVREIAFRRTTSVNKLLAMTARKKVVQGSTGAGKTFSIIPILIDRACKTPGLKITVVCETIPGAKEVADDIFKPIMQTTGRWRDSGWIGSPMQYKFANGSRIQFKAFDTPGKAKQAGKRDILFINEANHIPYEIADMLMTRSKEIWLDFNADVEFWAHTEVLKEPNTELLILTFEDNEAIPAEAYEELMVKKAKAYHDPNGPLDDKENIKSEYWYNWWKVFGRGLIGNISELRIMPLLNKATSIPEDAIEIPNALDFGWFPDPTYFGKNYIVPKKNDRENDKLYIVPYVYDTKLSINAKGEGVNNLVDILVRMGIDKNSLTIAESADPRAVNDMRMDDFNIEKVKKKRVEESIRYFHDYDIYIVFEFPEIAQKIWDEFDLYKYDKDKTTGEILKVPAKGQADHGIDGCFVAGTMISTKDGLKPIESIQAGDFVHTSSGLHEVLKTWDNGVKEISAYRIQTEIFTTLVTCTNDHQIKTGKTWTPAKSLSPNTKVSLHKSLIENAISGIKVKDIIAMEVSDFIKKSGSVTMDQYLMDFTFIMWMKTRIIIQLIILNAYLDLITFNYMVRSGLSMIQNGLKIFNLRALKKLLIGINQKKARSGTENMRLIKNSIFNCKSTRLESVNAAKKNIRHSCLKAGSVPISVNQSLEDCQALTMLLETVKNVRRNLSQTDIHGLDSVREVVVRSVIKELKPQEIVYDLTVSDNPEFFANGLLVHNSRYVLIHRGSRWTV